MMLVFPMVLMGRHHPGILREAQGAVDPPMDSGRIMRPLTVTRLTDIEQKVPLVVWDSVNTQPTIGLRRGGEHRILVPGMINQLIVMPMRVRLSWKRQKPCTRLKRKNFEGRRRNEGNCVVNLLRDRLGNDTHSQSKLHMLHYSLIFMADFISRGSREETIIARIPIGDLSHSTSSRRPYAEVYSVPAATEQTNPVTTDDYLAPEARQSVRVPSPQLSVRSVHMSPSPQPVPLARSATLSRNVPFQSGVAPTAPLPWPVPPISGPSRMALSSLRDRILARLFDMGITSSSQPELMDILDGHANRTTASDEEVLADVISALNINGRPSPRPQTTTFV